MPVVSELSREDRRKLMPLCTKFIDEMREVFGPENIVAIFARENGNNVHWVKPVKRVKR